MTSRKLILFLLVVLLSSLFIGAPPAAADSSHARIIRLSLVQGDVRFARQTHGDPLSDSSATWETVSLNLPIRQGYVLATDKAARKWNSRMAQWLFSRKTLSWSS